MALQLTRISLADSRRKYGKYHGLRPDSGSQALYPLTYNENQKKALLAAEGLARTCGYEAGHTQHVTRLALQLFDSLRDLHRLGATERFYLECAGILHDIGWVEGWKGHHKTALNIILRTTLLPLEHRERLVIGSIARYHTRATPSLKHDHFVALSRPDRRMVLELSALLRLADGLDRTHRSQIKRIECKVTRRKIRLFYEADQRQRKNEKAALKNSDLLQQAFERQFSIRWKHA